MRKQLFKGFCAALLLAFVIFVVCQLHGAREPTYQEKPLSFWVSQQQRSWLRSDSPSRLEADRAIRSIGTNALPFLLKWTSAKDAPLKKKLMALAKKQSLIKVRFHCAEEYHVKADAGFAALGALAKSAVSALIELLNQSDTMVRVAAEYDLMWIGPEAQDAVPVLVRCLNEQQLDGEIPSDPLPARHSHEPGACGPCLDSQSGSAGSPGPGNHQCSDSVWRERQTRRAAAREPP